MLPHDLVQEFPALADKIHELKVTNAHFRRLFDEYHDLNRAIERIETGNENASDAHLDKQRTHRVYLKDELYKMLQTL